MDVCDAKTKSKLVDKTVGQKIKIDQKLLMRWNQKLIADKYKYREAEEAQMKELVRAMKLNTEKVEANVIRSRKPQFSKLLFAEEESSEDSGGDSKAKQRRKSGIGFG